MPRTRPAPPSARERIGGRWAISWRLFAVTALLIAASYAAGRSGLIVGPFRSPLTPLDVVCQILAVGAVLAVADRTLFRHRVERPVPIWWVVGLGVAGGVARVAVQAAFAEPTVVDATTVVGVLAVVALGSLTPPIVAYLTATREWYVEQRERLILRAAEAEAERMRAIGDLRELALATVQTDLRRVQDLMRDGDSAPTDVADALLTAARGGVRPAARELFDRPAPTRSRIALRDVVATEFHRAPLPILVPAIAFALLIAPRALVAKGPLAAVVVPAGAVLGILVVFPIGRRLIRRFRRLALPITVVACGLAVVPIVLLGRVGVATDAPLAVYAASAALLVVLVAVAAMVATAEELGEELLDELGRPIREAEVERMAADRARDMLLREVALHLHGTVQSGLIAASYAIQDAVAMRDPDALEAALARARAVLESDVRDAEGDSGIRDDLAGLAAEWEGMLQVDWRIDGVGDVPAVVPVVRECLANAVVHGRAAHAVVGLRREGDEVVVEVEDDGRGPQGGGAGVGSGVLDRATAGAWRIAPREGGGTRVVARVPV